MLVVAFTNSSAAGNLTFTPPLVEKMKIELAIQDWEQADDTANRVSTLFLISKSCRPIIYVYYTYTNSYFALL